MKVNPGRPDRGYLYLKYAGHIAFLTGKTSEAFPVPDEATTSGLISRLDEKYRGLKSIFYPPGGFFNSQTGILVRRTGEPTFSVNDEGQEIRAGDIITLW